MYLRIYLPSRNTRIPNSKLSLTPLTWIPNSHVALYTSIMHEKKPHPEGRANVGCTPAEYRERGRGEGDKRTEYKTSMVFQIVLT